MPSFFGLTSIGACVAVLAWVIPDEDVRRPMWFFVFLALAASAYFCWSHPKAPKCAKGWLRYVGYAVLGGALLVAFDTFIHGVGSGNVIFDIMAFGGGAIVALSGLVRSLTAGARNDV